MGDLGIWRRFVRPVIDMCVLIGRVFKA